MPHARGLRPGRGAAEDAEDSESEEVIFLSADQGRPDRLKDDSDPEIIEVGEAARPTKVEVPSRKDRGKVHLLRPPFPWRRWSARRSAEAAKREEASSPDVTDSALVEVVGSLPKRGVVAEVATSAYRTSPRLSKEPPQRKLRKEHLPPDAAPAAPAAPVRALIGVRHIAQKGVSAREVRPYEEVELVENEKDPLAELLEEPNLKVPEPCQEPAPAEPLQPEEPAQPEENLVEKLLNEILPTCREVRAETQESTETPETVGDVEVSAPEDHAVSVTSSSSSQNPEIQALRQRIDACVATQGPLRAKGNEMLRSLHHHRALLKAARKEMETSHPEVASQVRRAQLVAELRHSHGQVREVHAHCIAENLDLREKLRASLERREHLANQLSELQAQLEEARHGIPPPPGLEMVHR